MPLTHVLPYDGSNWELKFSQKFRVLWTVLSYIYFQKCSPMKSFLVSFAVIIGLDDNLYLFLHETITPTVYCCNFRIKVDILWNISVLYVKYHYRLDLHPWCNIVRITKACPIFQHVEEQYRLIFTTSCRIVWLISIHRLQIAILTLSENIYIYCTNNSLIP